MSPEDREVVTRSIANLWTFQGMLIGQLLYSLRKRGLAAEEIEELLQALDAECDTALDGEDDRQFAGDLLATVRARLAREP